MRFVIVTKICSLSLNFIVHIKFPISRSSYGHTITFMLSCLLTTIFMYLSNQSWYSTISIFFSYISKCNVPKTTTNTISSSFFSELKKKRLFIIYGKIIHRSNFSRTVKFGKNEIYKEIMTDNGFELKWKVILVH